MIVEMVGDVNLVNNIIFNVLNNLSSIQSTNAYD